MSYAIHGKQHFRSCRWKRCLLIRTSVTGTRLPPKIPCGQPKPAYNHPLEHGEIMSFLWHPRHGRLGANRVCTVIGIAALFSLLVARNVPPEFPKVAPLRHSATNSVSLISSVSSHDQRPRFDCGGLQWIAPLKAFLPFPPAETSSHLTSPSQIFPAFRNKGPHFNRPPPVA
jgi:hypothetical protein